MRIAGIFFALILVATPAVAQNGAVVAFPELQDVYGVLEIANFEMLQQHLVDFVGAIEPGFKPPAIFGTFAGTMARTMNPGIIDDTYPYRIFFVAGPEGKMGYAVVFATKGAGAYRSTLYPRLKSPITQDGITVYSEEKRVLDRAAIEKATPEERELMLNAYITTTEPFAIAEQENWIIAGTAPGVVAELQAAVREGLIGLERLIPGEDDIAIHLDGPKLVTRLSEREGGMLGRTRRMLGAFAKYDDEEQSAFAKEMLNEQIDAAEKILEQFSTLDATLNLSSQGQNIRATATFKEESPLAQYFNGTTSGALETLRYIPNDYSSVFAFKIGDTQILRDTFSGIQTKLADRFIAKGFEIDRDVFLASTYNYAKEGVFGIRKDGEQLRFIKAAFLRDEELGRKTLALVPKILEVTFAAMEKDPEAVDIAAETIDHNGREIVKVSVDLSAIDTTVTGIGNPGQATTAAEMYSILFGKEFSCAVTIIDGVMLSTNGSGSAQTLEQIIDKNFKSILENEPVKALINDLPEDATGFAFVRLPEFVNILVDLLKRTPTPLPFSSLEFEKGPGATAVVRSVPNGSALEISIPAGEVKVIVDGIKEAVAEARIKKEAATTPPPANEPPPQD